MSQYIISYVVYKESSDQITGTGNLALSYNLEDSYAKEFFDFISSEIAVQANCKEDCILITGVFKL